MTQMNFRIDTYGYATEEVDKYIDMLQSEYNNAVQWGNEIERQLEEMKSTGEVYAENERLKRENEKLLSDCKLLAGKLKSLSGQQERNADPTPSKPNYDTDTAKVVNGIISAANKKAQEIVNEAYKTQDNIFSSAIVNAQLKLDELENSRLKAEEEIANLAKIKDEIIEKLNSVKDVLDA